MKQVILSIVIALTSTVVMAQVNVRVQPANYEAANWKTWLLDNPPDVTIVAPPTAAKSKAELQTIRQAMSKPDEKKLVEIKYWDAGAPAYRWNHIIPGLISQKQEVQIRIPGAWMNLAIY